MTTLTMGIDLAAQATNTAVCVLAWDDDGRPQVRSLRRGRSAGGERFTDRWLASTAAGFSDEFDDEITKVGIDDPFGWPATFLAALALNRDRSAWPSGIDEPRDRFRLRKTDRVVHDRSGKWPLSVSADRIAIPAMRCAVLLTDISERRGPESVARDGSGLCCEVYPDPALRLWTEGSAGDLRGTSYKGKDFSDRRVRLLASLQKALPFGDPGGELDRVALEDDYLDALVCALVARAVELGQTHLPEGEDQIALAATKGWIHLPTGPLGELIPAALRRSEASGKTEPSGSN